VYRISLIGWAWPLVGRPVPDGRARRGAVPPVVPLALLNHPATAGRLAGAYAERAARAGGRTANRELSALRSAAGWWREQGWICADPVAGLQHHKRGAPGAPLSPGQVTELFRVPASLREHAFWRLLFDSGAPAKEVLNLDAGRLDLVQHRTQPRPAGTGNDRADLQWQDGTSQILRWLLAGRTWGPAFLTGRKAPAGTPAADVCPVTGQGRMSYRRAAEIFTAATKPLDPAGRGWTLHQLSTAAMTVRRGA
jgi:integrase/recombinase XerD